MITSLLDTDFYKFTMGQLVFKRFRDVPVRYEFINRNKNFNICESLDMGVVAAALDNIMGLRLNNSELHYIRGTNEYSERMFSEDYLQFLRDLQLPKYTLKETTKYNWSLSFEGPWSKTIYWETLALAAINELLHSEWKLNGFERETALAEGTVRLAKKIKTLKEHPEISFIDFGTRRRFSKNWHDYVVKNLTNELSPLQFRGTSNVQLAMKYGLAPMGTSAHELFMIMTGIARRQGTDKRNWYGKGSDIEQEIYNSHNHVLRTWWDQYGYGLSVALTDTFGSDFFFKDMSKEQARTWKGLRQDSGDPIAFGEKAIKFYQGFEIDPKDKLIVFSDGLNIDSIIRINEHFKGRIKTSFGWGTNLTNDLGIEALPLVIKPVWADGFNIVKLSDDPGKVSGPQEDIDLMKKVFNAI